MGATNIAISGILSSVISSYSTAFTHIGVGDGVTTPTVSDTTLTNETDRDALFDTLTDSTFSVSGSIFLDTTENNGNDIRECGIFDALTGGNMLSHSLTNTISKTSSIEVFIEILINLEVANI